MQTARQSRSVTIMTPNARMQAASHTPRMYVRICGAEMAKASTGRQGGSLCCPYPSRYVASAEDKLEYSEGVQVATSQEYGNDHCTCDKATTASILPITFGKGGAS